MWMANIQEPEEIGQQEQVIVVSLFFLFSNYYPGSSSISLEHFVHAYFEKAGNIFEYIFAQ
jgi:hypothetical protein